MLSNQLMIIFSEHTIFFQQYIMNCHIYLTTVIVTLATSLQVKYCYHHHVLGAETEAQKMLNDLTNTLQVVSNQTDI